MKFNLVIESILDKKQETLNPEVWDLSTKIINPEIKSIIFKVLRDKKIKYSQVYLIGSITTKFWSKESDIDITVFCDLPDETIISYRKLLGVINYRYYFAGFPINFYFRNDFKYIQNIDDFLSDSNHGFAPDGLYNLESDDWVIQPLDIDITIDSVIEKPMLLAKKIANGLNLILDDISDDVIEIIDRFKTANFDFNGKITELELELNSYIETLSDLHQKRIKAFTAKLEGEDYKLVKEYKSRNILPYNIIYKFLVKNLYYKWYLIFKDAQKDESDKKREIRKVFENFVKFWRGI